MESVIMISQEPRHTGAWMAQVWISFVVSVGTTAVGIAYLPVDTWVRAFLGMGVLFTVGSCFSLAKALRDEHEDKRLISRIDEAKTTRILRDFEKEVT